MVKAKRLQILESISTVSEAMGKLVQFKNLYIAIMVGSLIYLSANYPTIGIPQGTVFVYAILSLFGLAWAWQSGVNLDALNWRSETPLSRKIIKTPERTYLVILYMMASAIITALVIIWLEGITPDMSLDSSAKLEIAWQQLFVVTLSETVLFVGILPIILMKVLFGRQDGGLNATLTEWGVVYVISQSAFALMHNFVYGGDVLQMIRVGMLGIIWLWMGRNISIGVAWGSHFGLNMAVLGLITFGGM